jgi:predicted transcriptional regulator
MQYVATVRGDWRAVARALGISYRDLARMTGKSLSSVKSYGTGRRTPPAAWLAEVSGIFARHGQVHQDW